MAKVFITRALKEEIFRVFKEQSESIFKKMYALEHNPHKGKSLGHVGKTVIKEVKSGTHRFYFITDGHKLKFGSREELAHLLIKFVRMSDKKNQQKTIIEIKRILKSMGFSGF